ncbi:ABC transporter substrate-binding protein [Microterricola pindariensis]|uniref:Solute-binding protein family 5 domain-containing protein n=1 Tax=Microterricola pindariensis TaxID=478010 RepID=A0ABX5AZZ0_9MICO|nr:ABC transporter substrate-binding protein [Microterricola pindariensis]PPL20395.1 hypothetical protein GY24_01070 [Microterricola pindariensis]
MRTQKKIWLTGIALATGAVLALSGCAAGGTEGGGGAEPGPAADQTLTIAALQDLASFDTGALDTGRQVQYWQPVYDTLLTVAPDGTLEANLATEWSYNDDNTVLTLTLRDDVTFSDGEPFNAEAVKANIEHLQAGTGVSVYMVGLVDSVEVVDEFTVSITMKAPDPAFTYYLGLVAGAMASPAAFGTDSFATVPVGSGPYLLDTDATIRGSEYRYVRNPDYWNAEAYPYSSIVVKPMDDLTARLNAIKSGQVNAAEVDASVQDEADASGLTSNTIQLAWNGLIIFDRAGVLNPALGDVKVRQALNHAVDSEAIVENIYGGTGYASQQIFNKKSPAHIDEFEDAYPFDPAKAKALLAEAGYADGFEITMPELPGDLTQPFVTQQLADIGVTVNWEKVAPEEVVGKVLGGEYAIASFGSTSGHPWRDISKMIAAKGAWNPFGATSPELEAALATVQATTGAEQDAAYQAVNKYVTDNAWFAVNYFADNIVLTDAATSTQMQFGSSVPYIRNYAPVQ